MQLLLAQTTPEAVTDWVGVLERILAGGVPLICLVGVVVIGWAYWKQLKRNNTLETSWRKQVETDAGNRLADAGQRLTDQERLMREQIGREREAQEAVTAAVQAVEGFSYTLQEQQVACDETKRVCLKMVTKLDDVAVKLKDLEDTLRRRFRDA